MADETRCVAGGCGRVFEPGDELIRVAAGTFRNKGGFKEKKEWGLMHRSCFNRAIDSPDATMEEVRRLSEEV
jgi:hypothetical protein